LSRKSFPQLYGKKKKKSSEEKFAQDNEKKSSKKEQQKEKLAPQKKIISYYLEEAPRTLGCFFFGLPCWSLFASKIYPKLLCLAQLMKSICRQADF